MLIKDNRVNLGNAMLNERGQSQKCTYYMTPFIRNVHNREIYRKQFKTGGDDGGLAMTLKEHGVSIGANKNVLQLFL